MVKDIAERMYLHEAGLRPYSLRMVSAISLHPFSSSSRSRLHACATPTQALTHSIGLLICGQAFCPVTPDGCNSCR